MLFGRRYGLQANKRAEQQTRGSKKLSARARDILCGADDMLGTLLDSIFLLNIGVAC